MGLLFLGTLLLIVAFSIYDKPGAGWYTFGTGLAFLGGLVFTVGCINMVSKR